MTDIRILINGTLNEQETQKIISEQLETIGKNLKVTIGVNDNELDALAKKVGKLQEQINKNQTSVVSNTETKKLQSLSTDLQEIINKQKELGQVSYKTTFNPLTEQVEKLDITLERANGEVKRLKYELASLKNIEVQGKNPYILTSEQTIDKSQAIREKQLKQEEAINKQLEERKSKQAKEISNLEHTIKLYKERARIQVSGLVNRYGNDIDSKALETYLNNIRNISATTPDARKRMEELSLAYRDIANNARIATGDSIKFGDALNQAMTKFPIKNTRWEQNSSNCWNTLRAI